MKYEFRFPDIGEGIAEGTLLKWLVNKGDTIKEGQSVAEVETDKVTTEIPSPKSGKVVDLKFKEGDIIEVEQVFIIIDPNVDNDSKAQDQPQNDEKIEAVEEETAGVVGEVIASSEEIPPSTEGQEVSSPKENSKAKVLATPVARKLAKDLSVDITTINGTGPNGRVMKKDIKEAAKQSVAKPKENVIVKPAAPVYKPEEDQDIERISLSSIRKTISKQMEISKFTIPHVTAMEEINITELVDLRKKYKEKLSQEDIYLTYLPFIIKALVFTLKKYPIFNASYDSEHQELILKHFYHMGIATDTERGLMVPVVKDVDKKSIVTLANDILDVTSRAKENNVNLQELRGSTFSVTNYGSVGGLFATPVINYPEIAILGLGRIVEKPIVKDDRIVIAKILPVSLAFDHRFIDGAGGSRFLNTLADLLEDPEMLLLKG